MRSCLEVNFDVVILQNLQNVALTCEDFSLGYKKFLGFAYGLLKIFVNHSVLVYLLAL